MYQLTQCCCLLSLRIGTLIIGLLYLIGSIISLAGLVVAMVFLADMREYIRAGEHHVTKEYFLMMVRVGPGLLIANKVIVGVMLVLCVMQIVIDILLIVGAATRKAKLTLPWLILNVVLFIFNLTAFGAISILGFMYMETTVNLASISPIVLGLIYLGVTVYSMLIVNSFYENFKTMCW